MQTDFQKLLDLELPLIQAPMAGVQGSGLAIAVSRARGLSDFTPLWSGQNASGCREIAAADMVRELVSKL